MEQIEIITDGIEEKIEYKEIIKECNFKYLCYFINRKKYKFYI